MHGWEGELHRSSFLIKSSLPIRCSRCMHARVCPMSMHAWKGHLLIWRRQTSSSSSSSSACVVVSPLSEREMQCRQASKAAEERQQQPSFLAGVQSKQSRVAEGRKDLASSLDRLCSGRPLRDSRWDGLICTPRRLLPVSTYSELLPQHDFIDDRLDCSSSLQ